MGSNDTIIPRNSESIDEGNVNLPTRVIVGLTTIASVTYFLLTLPGKYNAVINWY